MLEIGFARREKGRTAYALRTFPMETISCILINEIGTGYLKSRLEAYAIVPLFERAQKDPAGGGGVTPASLRAVHSGRIMGQEAVSSGA